MWGVRERVHWGVVVVVEVVVLVVVEVEEVEGGHP